MDIACEILEYNFTSERLFPIIDSSVNMVRELVENDPILDMEVERFDEEVQFIKDLIEERIQSVQADLAALGKTCEDFFPPVSPGNIVINEFAASNSQSGGIADPNGGFPDWIELYNNTDETVSLENFYLSNDFHFLKHWSFPKNSVIEPHEYLIVWADRDLHEEGLHSDFKLAKSGGQLFLSFEDLTVLDSVSYDEQETDKGFVGE